MADANVRVLISALTEAAEQSIEDVGNEMQNVQADGHLAAEGLDAASDEMSEASRTAMILQSALDEVGDEAMGAGMKAEFLQHALDEVDDEATQAAVASQGASGSFSSLSISSQGAALSVGSLSTAFTLSLIPAVLTALTVLAPLVVTLGALAAGAAAVAGAFGLIIGSGILAFGDKRAEQNQKELAQTNRLISQYESMKETQGSLTAQQQERLRQLRKKKDELQDQTTATGALAGVVGDLKEELKPLIVDFGREFIPLIEDAVEAIPGLVSEIFGAIGGTDQFKDALRDFGRLAADVLPELIALMFDMAELTLPVLRDLVSFLKDNGSGAMDAMGESVNELKPELMDLLDSLIDLAPTLLKFGTYVGEEIIPAITWLVDKLDGFLETINRLDPRLRSLVIKFMLLAPAIIWVMGKVTALKGLIIGGRGLMFALRGLTTLLASGGTVSAASVYGAAILAGAGLGVLGVKALDAMGAIDKLEESGQDLRETLGGENADALLAGTNRNTMGGLELVSMFGGAVRGVADPDKTIGGQMEKVGNVFDNAENARYGGTDDEDQLVPEGNRIQRGGTRSTQQGANVPNTQIQRQIQNTQVQVDVAGDLNSDPHTFSRDLADQVNRERRSNSGT